MAVEDVVVDTKVVPEEAKAAPVVVQDPLPTDGKTVPEAKVEPKIDAKIEPKVDAKVEPKGEPKVEPKVEPKAKEKPVEATWPADWREKAAGGDEKKLAKLQRYASPQAVADALVAAQTKLGEKGSRLPKDATPEQLTAWREENGVPDKPEKYDVKLSGIDIGEADKPLIDKFLASSHASNMTNDQVKASLQTYYEVLDQAREARATEDKAIQTKTEDDLRGEWGAEFRRNMNLLTNLLDTAGTGMRDKILLGRLADGTPIGSSPEALKFLVGVSLRINPQGTVVPSGQTTDTSVADELAKISKFRSEHRSEYNKNEAMQARERELITWQASNKK